MSEKAINNKEATVTTSSNVLDYFKPITTFVFDVDGVLTDGSILLLENGLQARRMNIKDGLALQMALKKGYRVVVISGAYSEPVLKRLQYLGIEEIYLATKNKLQLLEKYKEEHQLQWQEMLYMGDDLPDVPVLQAVGLPACPADAAEEVISHSKYVSGRNGGSGCVRDVIEKVLRLNNHWHYETEVVSK